MRRSRSVVLFAALVTSTAVIATPTATASSTSRSGDTDHRWSVPAHEPWQGATHTTTTRKPATSKLVTAAPLASTVPLVVLQAYTYPWSYYGDPVDLSGIADLSRLPGGGTMIFYDGKTSLGAATVDFGGVAQMTTYALKPGKHALTATYKTTPKTGYTSPIVYVTVYKRPLRLYPVTDIYTRPVGAANPTWHVELAEDQGNGGLVNGDTFLSAVTGTPKFTTLATAKSPPGAYAVTLSGLSSVNYQLVYLKSGFVVYSKDLAAGMVAPNFTGKDQNGNDVSLSDFRGKVVLLDLSTIWCGPSNFMGNQIRDVVTDLQQRGIPFQYMPVQLEGPSPGHGGTQTNAFNFARSHHVPAWVHVLHPQGLEPTIGQPMPQLWDTFYSYSAQYTHDTGGTGAFPTLVVIKPDGTIGEIEVGSLDKSDLIPNHLDPAAPNTGVTVTSAPQPETNTTSVSFTADAATTCRSDGGTFAPCSSPYAPTLTDGIHEIQILSAGHTYAASVPFQLDQTPPDTTITDGPGSGTLPLFSFTSNDPTADFECRVDGGSWDQCFGEQWPIFDVPEGNHTFEVRAVDAFGNADATPDSRPFATQPLPIMTMEVQPANPTTSDSDVQILVTVMDANGVDPATGSVIFFECCVGFFPDGSETVQLDSSGHATMQFGQIPFPLSSDFGALYTGDSTHGAASAGVTLTVTP